MEHKKRALAEVQEALELLSVQDEIEVLANYFYGQAVDQILSKKEFALRFESDIIKEPDKFLELLAEYKRSYGEDIWYAMGHQSLLMWMWLEQE